MVGIAGGVNSGQALAAADEIQQRFAPRGSGCGIVGIVEELAGGVVQEEEVVLLQILRR